MKQRCWMWSAVLASALIVGCGGGSPAYLPNTGSTTSTANSFSMASSIKINGGQLLTGVTAPTTPGTYNFVLKDNLGNSTTFSNVLLPLPSISTTYTIVRAGSNLFSGTYNSTTATIHDLSGHQGTIPLNSDGTLAQDIAFSLGQLIVLPISTDGSLQFQGGVTVAPNIIVSNNTQDIQVNFSTNTSSLASGSITGPLTFSGGGTSSTYAKIGVNFEGSANGTAPNLSVQGTTIPPSRNSTVVGTVTGSSMVYTTSQVTINVND